MAGIFRLDHCKFNCAVSNAVLTMCCDSNFVSSINFRIRLISFSVVILFNKSDKIHWNFLRSSLNLKISTRNQWQMHTHNILLNKKMHSKRTRKKWETYTVSISICLLITKSITNGRFCRWTIIDSNASDLACNRTSSDKIRSKYFWSKTTTRTTAAVRKCYALGLHCWFIDYLQ